MAQGIQALISHSPHMHPSGAQREQHQERVDSVAQEEVGEDDKIKYRDPVVEK